MKILVVGGGGREHALAWKAAQSPSVEKVYVAPGNAGTARESKVENLGLAGTAALLDFAQRQNIGLTLVGPEQPLAEGMVDAFTQAGLRCFGPIRAAAQLEASKAFAKAFMARHRIPSAAYQEFTDIGAATAYIAQSQLPLVIKADGLAAGKGVVIAHSRAEAEQAASQMLSGAAFGDAGRKVVIEEFLAGEEASFICMVGKGGQVLPLATSQDHKAVGDGDTGANTGGMGAYSPAPVVTAELHARVMREIIAPTVQGLAAEGIAYSGFLYAGLMIDAAGNPKVLEYNCRFGDPETQPILLRLRSDLVELCQAALDGRLDQVRAVWEERPALGVVMAAGGYPDSYEKGNVISGLPSSDGDGSKVFHAGTALANGSVVTNGGRVLCVCALGETVGQAQARAYQVVDRIHWKNAYCRRDIGYRAVARERG
jgi:phosphoribosylamine--glycine ligase